MLQNSSSNQTSSKVLTNQAFEASRESVPHIIGSLLGVRRTIHQLHAARYADVACWTHPLPHPSERIAIPDDHRIIITPQQGEIMSLLVKLIRLQ
jgi:hypothetical protein